MNIFNCPVCGYGLNFSPWEEKNPSFEICPSCGTQFGYDDAAVFKGDTEVIKVCYRNLREKWIAGGMKWSSQKNPFLQQPKNWDPANQLKNAEG